ncbi:MAG TPA: TonB-dependent receptor [Rhizomicrobium sp.]|jgi:outer membrane receptor protein involved in Fe transport
MQDRLVRSRGNTRLLPFLLASTVLAGATPAAAQIETVVVTAEKRSEDVQKAPLAIQVLGSEKLQQLNVQSFSDYIKYVPSVTYTAGGQNGGAGGPGFATVTMRGVSSGNDGNHSGSLPTVGIYLDEQPVTTIGGALDVHTYDINRVEVLEGPQGTLYGASSEAGTIRIITNKPDPTGFSASYDLQANTVAHGSQGYTAEGYVNVPLADNIAIRLVAFDEHDAGYVDNVPGTRTFPSSGITINNANLVRDNFNFTDTYGGRAALKIDLNDNWSITPTIIAQDTRANGSFAYDPSVGDLEVQHFNPDYAHDKWYQAALTIEGKIGDVGVVYSGGYMNRILHTANDYTDYSYFYDKIYGYGAYIYDAPGHLIDPSQYIIGYDRFTKESHELRFTTPDDSPVRFVGGAFYERQSHHIGQDYKIAGLGPLLSVPGWTDTIWLTNQERIDRDYAIFGEVTWDIADNLKFTAGGRAFWADNSLYGFFGFSDAFSSHTGVSQCFAAPIVANTPCTDLDKRVNESGWTHKVNLSWQIDDDKMVYATVSTGFRPGGVNRRDNPPPNQIPPYNPDKLFNYEVGWKTTLDDGKVRFNGSAYLEDWQDFQFSFLGLNSFTEIHNAGTARIYGLESEVVWQPNEHFMFSANGAYNDAFLTSDYCGKVFQGKTITQCPGPLDPAIPDSPSGTSLPGVPRLKGNLIGRYNWNAFNDVMAHVQGAMSYQSASWPDLRVRDFNPITGVQQPVRGLIGEMPSFASFDFTAGIDWGNSELELMVQNAFDERGQLYRFAECNTLVCGNEPYVVPNHPRLIGLKFSQKFGADADNK